MALIDTGCSRTIVVSAVLEIFKRFLRNFGLKIRLRRKVQKFHGIGGNTLPKVEAVIPIFNGDKMGHLRAAVVPGDIPLLLSRVVLQRMDAVISFPEPCVHLMNHNATLPLVLYRGHIHLDFSPPHSILAPTTGQYYTINNILCLRRCRSLSSVRQQCLRHHRLRSPR